jgi:mitochondrial fission protein ELM1
VADAGAPLVWALVGQGEAADAQVLGLAEALGWPFETKRLVFNAVASLPSTVLGASLRGLDTSRSSPLAGPWPQLVIASGRRAVPVARWIRQQAGEGTRLVQLGRPGAPFDLFDLVVAQPDQRLPIRDNVLQVSAPLAGLRPEALETERAREEGGLADLPRPWTVLFLGHSHPFVMPPAKAEELGRLAGESVRAEGGALVVHVPHGTARAALDAVVGSAGCSLRVIEPSAAEAEGTRAALLALAGRIIVTGDDPDLLAGACLTGKPVALFELPLWYDRLVVVRPMLGLLAPLIGGGASYRGTPHQQTIIGRLLDEATVRGLLALPRDPLAFHRTLIARGLVTTLKGGTPVASPKPLDDLARAVERVRRLMTEVSQRPGAA